MTDGPTIQKDPGYQALLGHIESAVTRKDKTTSPIDLTAYAQWIELQPLSTLTGILDVSANDLYRRHWSTYGAQVKQVVRDLLALSRHQGQADE